MLDAGLWTSVTSALEKLCSFSTKDSPNSHIVQYPPTFAQPLVCLLQLKEQEVTCSLLFSLISMEP